MEGYVELMLMLPTSLYRGGLAACAGLREEDGIFVGNALGLSQALSSRRYKREIRVDERVGSMS